MSISSVCDRDDKVVLVLFQLLLDIMLFFTSADVHYSCSMMIMRMLVVVVVVVVMVVVIVMVMMIDFTNQSSTLTTSHQTNDSINHKEKCASKLHTRNHSTFPLAFFFSPPKEWPLLLVFCCSWNKTGVSVLMVSTYIVTNGMLLTSNLQSIEWVRERESVQLKTK